MDERDYDEPQAREKTMPTSRSVDFSSAPEREDDINDGGLSGPGTHDEKEAAAEAARVLALLNRDGVGRRPSDIKGDIQKAMNDFVGVVRNDEGLGAAIGIFDGLAAGDLPAMATATRDRIANYDWIEALEVKAMVPLAGMIAAAARRRTESRGAHQREDFEDMDPAQEHNQRLRLDENGALVSDYLAVAKGMAA